MSLIGLKEMSRADLLSYLDAAEEFLTPDGNVHTPPGYRSTLAGKTLGLLFFEPSTRTRVSFELAAHRLGAYSVLVTGEASSFKKGESVLDTCRNMAAMGVDGFVVRHQDRDIPHTLFDHLDAPIINAGNGSDEHPTQGLLDVFTLRRHWDGVRDFEGKTVAIVGDIVHSRVARSTTHALKLLGARVILAGPRQMLPKESSMDFDATTITTRAEALAEADAVIVLRIQRERISGSIIDGDMYIQDWGIDHIVAENEMKPDAVLMHPGPVIRGMELGGTIVDSPRSLILRQVTHGVAIRQAVLARLLG